MEKVMYDCVRDPKLRLLLDSCAEGREEEVRKFLDVDDKRYHCVTPLILAASRGHCGVAR